MLYTDYLDNFVQRNTLNPDQIDWSNISDKIAAWTITMSETAFSYMQNWVTPAWLVWVDFITDKLDAEAGYIKWEFTFTESWAIAMSTDANNWLWISPNGILWKKNGNNTFTITNQWDATFGWNVTWATISWGTIAIWSSNSIFKADSNWLYLWNATFANAPFRVDMNGNVTLTNWSISWANISAPSYTQVTWTKPPTNADNTYSTIWANRLTYITSTWIYSWTITGNTVQTSEYTNTGIKMSSALGGIVIYDQSLYIKNSNNSLIGYLYANYDATPTNDGSEWRLGLVNESGIDTFIGASKNIILSSQFVVPYADNTVYLGGSTTNEGGGCANDWTWKYIGGQIIDAKDKYQILGIDCIDISGTGVYFKGDGAVYLQGNGTDSDIKTTSSRIDLYHDTYTTGSNIMSGSVYLNSTTTQTDNGWRLVASGGNLLIQKSVSGSWVTKSTIAG